MLGDQTKNEAAISAGYPGYEKEVENALKIGMSDYYTTYYYTIPNAADAKNNAALKNLSEQMLADEYIKNYKAQNSK